MHRFRSRRAIIKLRLGSFFFVVLFVSTIMVFPTVIWGTLLHREDLPYAAILLAVMLVSGIGYLLVGSGVRCPLCHGPIIGKSGCSRNRNASRTLGSYRFGVASRVLLGGTFLCPSCGEPCKCEARI